MSLFTTFELLENEKQLRLTYAVDNYRTETMVVGIENLFKELMNEHNKSNDLLNKITSSGKNRIFS